MEKTRTLDLRPLLAVLALGLAAAVVWAATALAGGTSGNAPAGGTGGNAPSFVQQGDGYDGHGGGRENCPEKDGGATGSSNV